MRLDALLDVNALPGSGYLSKANRERESEEWFVSARRAHPAIESAINGLEHRGLDRVRLGPTFHDWICGVRRKSSRTCTHQLKQSLHGPATIMVSVVCSYYLI